jgi:hypothetical protein
MTFPTPVPSDPLSAPSHAQLHDDINNAVDDLIAHAIINNPSAQQDLESFANAVALNVIGLLAGQTIPVMRVISGDGTRRVDFTVSPTTASMNVVADNGEAQNIVSRYSDNAFPPRMVFFKARGSQSSPSPVQNGDLIGLLSFQAFDGNDFGNFVARILAYVDGTPGTDDSPGRLVFETTPDGSNLPVERMRIRNDGAIILGTGGTGPQIRFGAGSPEGVVTAPPGSLYLNTSGGAGTSLYVKESGSGNTGWVGK